MGLKLFLLVTLVAFVRADSRLSTVLSNGYVTIGIRFTAPYNGLVNRSADPLDVDGFDADFAKALAAALFPSYGSNINSKIRWVEALSSNRFDQLQSGETDAIFSGTADMIGRQFGYAVSFARPNFYDTFGFLATSNAPEYSLSDLNTASVSYCVSAGSSAISLAAASLPLARQVVVGPTVPALVEAVVNGTCTVSVHAQSLLAPEVVGNTGVRLLRLTIGHQELGQVTLGNDDVWSAFVRWTFNGLVLAEYYNITRDNVNSINPASVPSEAVHLLGWESPYDGVTPFSHSFPGVRPDFLKAAIALVGNYGEIYNSWLQPIIPRAGTRNELWSQQGGTQFIDVFSSQAPGVTPTQLTQPILQRVLSNGKVSCGVAIDGMITGFIDGSGQNAGFGPALCQAIAAAVFKQATPATINNYLQYVPVTSVNRYDLLNTDAIDVLMHGDTATLGRDVTLQTTFSRPFFFDGQGFMVKPDSPYWYPADLDVINVTYCVRSGSDTILNAESFFKHAQPVIVDDANQWVAAVKNNTCNAVSGDLTVISPLASNGGLRILGGQPIAREPMAIYTRDGDPQWSAIVEWVMDGLLVAEINGITKANVDYAILQDPEAYAMLTSYASVDGFPSELSTNFMLNALRVVGNYGEIYERYAEQYIPRAGTQNELYTNGGLHIPSLWQWLPNAAPRAAPQSPTLQRVLARGSVNVGVNFGVAGYSVVNYSKTPIDVYGFDADFAKGFAAALFPDATNIDTVINWEDALPTTRWSQLQNGDIDALFYDSVDNIGRAFGYNVSFTRSVFYSGFVFLSRLSMPDYTNVADLNRGSMSCCVVSGSSAVPMAKAVIPDAQLVVITGAIGDLAAAVEAGTCRIGFEDLGLVYTVVKPAVTKVLPMIIGHQASCMATSNVDDGWAALVRWLVNGLVLAEEYSITQANVNTLDPMSVPPEGRHLLGFDSDGVTPFQPGLQGVRPDFMKHAIAQVGNYGEIYNRWLGTVTPRGDTPNRLYNAPHLAGFVDGLLYSDSFNGEAPSAVQAVAQTQNTLSAVQSYGRVRCGVSDNEAVLGMHDANGWHGLGPVLCQAIAAAVFPQATASTVNNYVQYVAVTNENRFDMLNNNTIDALMFGDTATIGRDVVLGLTYSHPYLYDGQGFIVPSNSIYNTTSDLDQPGVTYCVPDGTTTLANARAYFQHATPVLVTDASEFADKLRNGDCDAATSDLSLIAPIAVLDPSFKVLSGAISREPLAIYTRDGDPVWSNIVNWLVNGLLVADATGITQSSALSANPTDPDALAMLTQYTNAAGVPLATNFMRNVIACVGNYDEIYFRTVGGYIGRPGTLNALWLNGGIQIPDQWQWLAGATPVPSPPAPAATTSTTSSPNNNISAAPAVNICVPALVVALIALVLA